MKKYDLLAIEIIAAIGGKKNIQSVTHCATRLRFNLTDDLITDDKKIEAIEGVQGFSRKGGQYQIIIGNDVADYYEEIAKLTSQIDKESSSKPGQNKSIIDKIFDILSGTFVMFIPVLVAAGIISAILSLLTTFNIVMPENPTFIVFSAVQSAIFYFLPVFAGYASASKLNMNPFVGMALGLILCYSTINGASGLEIFGFSVPTVTYNSTVFPVLLGVTLMSFVEKGLKKTIPAALRTAVIPAVTLLVGVVATLLILGPIGSTLGEWLSNFIQLISSKAGWIAPAILGAMWPFIIFTGMHYSLIPLVTVSLASVGFDSLLMVAGFVCGQAFSGASFATAFLHKDKTKKTEAITIGTTALLGISEPALFGIVLRNKRTLLATCLGGFTGALFAGIMNLKAYGFVGGLPSLPLFINPKGGLENFIVVLISILISFIIAFVLTILLNRKDESNV